MSFNNRTYFILILGCFLLACKPDEEMSQPQLPYHFVEFTRYSSECATDSTRCAAFSAHYPEYDSAEAIVRDRINRNIKFNLMRSLADNTETDISSLDQIAKDFFNDYESFAMGGFSMPWELKSIGKVIHSDKKVFAIALDIYRFTGGAHPNTETVMFNYDLEEGKMLKLEDIISDLEGFSKIAEAVFRKKYNIADEVSFEEAGYFMEHFKLSSNFALNEEGVLLFYNTYEIAPYVAGITQFLIPYDRLAGILNPAYMPNAS